MRPTKEQLASTKWWRDNVPDDLDFLYECESTGEIAFANRDGRDNEGLRLRLELDIWKLLAKRPEPEWVPEVGVDCIQKMGRDDRKVSITYVGDGVGCYYDYKNEMEYTFSMRDSVFVPIKTQREELIDIVNQRELAENRAEAIAGAILARFDLTEKDGK